ncbi:MAG: AAA family ATPase [Nostoc sp.]|uniref:ParA family protein n=1 Tax=Nostoc sp. TaxID=1180 RepID=UPI002FF61DB1
MTSNKTKVISIFNNKGGVGKTIITWNLGDALARRGKKVLLIDFDPQSNLSIAMLGDRFTNILPSPENPYGTTIRAYLQRFLQNEGTLQLYKHKGNRTSSNVDLIASDAWLNVYSESLSVGSDLLTGNGLEKYSIISRLIQEANSTENKEYDYVLIDLPPSFNNLVRTALYSSNYFIVPCTSDIFCSYCVGLIGETLPRFIKEWQIGCQLHDTNNPHTQKYINLGKPVFAGWVFNGYDTRKPKDETTKKIIAADNAMGVQIIQKVKELVETLENKIKEHPSVLKNTSFKHFQLGGIEDMNILIQNSMWLNCPIAILDRMEPVRNLQDRVQWSPNQLEQIQALKNSFLTIADRVIKHCI